MVIVVRKSVVLNILTMISNYNAVTIKIVEVEAKALRVKTDIQITPVELVGDPK